MVPGRYETNWKLRKELNLKNMKKRSNYQSPRVLQEASLQLERSFLKASLVDTATVTAVGQEVEEHDFASDEFIHQWED